MTNVSTNLDFASSTVLSEKRFAFHGALSTSKAHLSASAPNLSTKSTGSSAFPLLLDIFCPSSSKTCPSDNTRLYGTFPVYSADTANKL